MNKKRKWLSVWKKNGAFGVSLVLVVDLVQKREFDRGYMKRKRAERKGVEMA